MGKGVARQCRNRRVSRVNGVKHVLYIIYLYHVHLYYTSKARGGFYNFNNQEANVAWVEHDFPKWKRHPPIRFSTKTFMGAAQSSASSEKIVYNETPISVCVILLCSDGL